MALQVDFTACQSRDCKSLDIEDETGLYDATTNPTGFGGINPSVSDVDVATIIVENPEGDTFEIDVYPTLPNTDGVKFTINNTDIGLEATDEIPDGLYLITYTVSGVFGSTAFESEKIKYVLFKCQVTCCMKEEVAELKVEDCECEDNEDTMDLLKRVVLLDSAKLAATCGQRGNAVIMLDYLLRRCGLKNPDNC